MSSFIYNTEKNFATANASAQKFSFYQPQPHARSAEAVPIVVHCHLHWDWVWQRPQQFLSRLAKTHPVLFIETHPPSPDLKSPTVKIRRAENCDVTILQIQIPLSMWHDGDLVDRTRRELVLDAMENELGGRFDFPIQWFYDPMAVTAFGQHLKSRAIVYDCMDELAQFDNAPGGIREREQLLLSLADVVFTGGRKLWESKKRFNANCFFYGCGVDVKHFERATKSDLPLPGDVETHAKPVLGYFGVVDERLDYQLIAKLADSIPDGNVVMVGPCIKVNPDHLPKRKNLHWLGGRNYSELPAYAKAFDVCLMPFALNAATEFINPTKALEYMATKTPVVSTPVSDVVSNFRDAVHIGRTAEEFIGHCRNAAAAPDHKKIRHGQKLAKENTWESIVAHLEKHVGDAMDRKYRAKFSPVKSVRERRENSFASLLEMPEVAHV